ncbi:hypothetical protein C8Q79DRAFT_107542 [Trametes meyenii]|nr:hypothetical protein C8Q79DRAFT_107542 [Trametes meyenii]
MWFTITRLGMRFGSVRRLFLSFFPPPSEEWLRIQSSRRLIGRPLRLYSVIHARKFQQRWSVSPRGGRAGDIGVLGRSAMSPRPHPILKRDISPFRSPTLPFSTLGPLVSPHVRFPPTPQLVAGTYPAHSPTTYDRAPIAVTPNVCQLPRRGERTVRTPTPDSDGERRGRTRIRSKGSGSRESLKGSYFHPRAYEACKPEPLSAPSAPSDLPSTPPLVQDLSPSDESDETITTPPDPNIVMPNLGPLPLHLAPAPRLSFADKPRVGSPPPRARPPLKCKPDSRKRRPDLPRTEGRTSPFSPDMDEGCLGGF